MSDSHNPADTQGLLQSMLQRLKLQPGRDGQSFPHTPRTTTAASTWSQNGDGEVSIHPINGFGINGVPSKQFGVSAAHSYVDFKVGEMQQPRHVSGMDKGLTSVPSLKDNTDNDLDENRVLDEVTSPDITPTGTGQLFPAKSPKGHNIASFEETVRERVTTANSTTIKHISGDKDAVANIEQNQIREQETDQDFTPKLYTWSLKPTHANVDTGNGENKVLHMGNGGFGAFDQRTDMQFVANSQTTKNSSSRRNQQSSEKKTRRWTQKIKERWLDRPGSFGKKGKARGGNVDHKVEQGTESLPQKQEQTAENLISSANREEGRIRLLLDSSDPSETLPSLPEESTPVERVRTSSDFDLCLGSFSLLEEIVTGQEWAKFLDPNLTASSANHTPREDPQSQFTSSPTSQDSGLSSLILNQQGDGSSQWSFRATESSPAPEFGSAAQESLHAFQPVSMDVSEVKQQQEVHRATDRSEPMEDEQSGQRQRPPFFVESSHTVVNSALKKVPLNRKRQHQSAERGERLHSEKTGVSSLMITQSHMMDETQHDFLMPLNTRNFTPTPLSPSFKPFAPPPRGVLKQSMSLDSESSVETETKRRRVEENRRVRFSEEVLTIDPPELGDYATDSEEDSGADSDSVIEHECEEEQAVTEEAAAASSVARRPALPAWIKALKRRSTGRKQSYDL
ncbi:hypothetical protein JOB18_028805 [Solea senegalensis]|uniref:Uncharacterized protein n=1 Tax=Solea senegalensis TaxID=28829 RepID=A0AAV6SM95_SOLSE|nr:uncharacterized protein zgc:113229 isoform X3 [Solea senegalensis]KAG7518224.1 hypothetical protein JOB18_028805 [Solea senegalensis]